MVEKLNRPQGPMASIAVGLDSVIKDYCNRYRPQGVLPPLLAGKLPGKLVPTALAFLKHVAPDTGATLIGKLDDCLVFDDGTYAPLDHKTRASFTGTVHASYQVQMDVYTFLLEANGYPVARKAYLVYYAPQKGELAEGFPFGVDVKELATNVSRAAELFHEAAAVLAYPEPPPPASACSFCAFVAARQ